MTGRTQRSPRQVAWLDQALAHARDQAAGGDTIVVVIGPPAGGRCSWCDCPDGADSPHNREDYRCTGCPTEGNHVAHLFNAGGGQRNFPLCDRHLPDFAAMVAALTNGGGSR